MSAVFEIKNPMNASVHAPTPVHYMTSYAEQFMRAAGNWRENRAGARDVHNMHVLRTMEAFARYISLEAKKVDVAVVQLPFGNDSEIGQALMKRLDKNLKTDIQFKLA